MFVCSSSLNLFWSKNLYSLERIVLVLPLGIVFRSMVVVTFSIENAEFETNHFNANRKFIAIDKFFGNIFFSK